MKKVLECLRCGKGGSVSAVAESLLMMVIYEWRLLICMNRQYLVTSVNWEPVIEKLWAP